MTFKSMNKSDSQYSQSDIVVIGGGAAGFMAAITAAELFAETKVMILEKNRTVLSKVKVSGGGRCNVTNAAESVATLCKGYPRAAKFLRPLFDKFNNQHTIQWFQNRGVALKTEPDGRVFPTTDNSQTIIDCLTKAATKANILVQTSVSVSEIIPINGVFEVILQNGEAISANKVVVTTGGHPQVTGYDWLARLGLDVVPPVPSLFTFNVPESPFHTLMGVAVADARVRVAGTKLESRGALLFTHWGISGPSVLRASAWGARELANKNYHFTALVNFTTYDTDDIARQALAQFRTDPQRRQKLIKTMSVSNLPARLWENLLVLSNIPETMRWADIPAKNLNRLAEYLTNCPFEVCGKTTFKEEFVTCGGLSLNNINPKTLESKTHKGLFLGGEVLDIDGITGGYNFQSAWTTGFIIGSNIGLEQ
jgi:predicted Rossmann fold flavoprotein